MRQLHADGRGRRTAYRIYNAALRQGALVRATYCSRCGTDERRIEGHHEDYSQPLVVQWLCTWCHRARHVETQTGAAGRPRCRSCHRIIYRHITDTGGTRQVDGGLVHSGKCARKYNALIARKLTGKDARQNVA